MTRLSVLLFALFAPFSLAPVCLFAQDQAPAPQQVEHARGASGSHALLSLHEMVRDKKHKDYLDGEILIFLPDWKAMVAFQDGKTRPVPTDELKPATGDDSDDDDTASAPTDAPPLAGNNDGAQPATAPGAPADGASASAPAQAAPGTQTAAAAPAQPQRATGGAYLIFADTVGDGGDAFALAHSAFEQLVRQRAGTVDLVVAGADDAKSPLQICDRDSPSGTCVVSGFSSFNSKIRATIWEEIQRRVAASTPVPTNRLELLTTVLAPFSQRYAGRPQTAVYLGSGNGFRALRVWARPGAQKSALQLPALSDAEAELRKFSADKHIELLALKSATELAALSGKGAAIPSAKAFVVFADAAADPTSVDRARQTVDLILHDQPSSLVDLLIATDADTKACQWCDGGQAGIYAVYGISEISASAREQTWKEAQNFKGPDTASPSADRLALLAGALGRYEKDPSSQRGVLYLGGGQPFHVIRNWARPSWSKPRVATAPAAANASEQHLRDIVAAKQVRLAALTSADELGAALSQQPHVTSGSEAYLIFADALIGGPRAVRRTATSIASIIQRQPGAKIDLVVAGAGKASDSCNWCDANSGIGMYVVSGVSDLSKFTFNATWNEINAYASSTAATSTKDAPARPPLLEAAIQDYAGRYRNRERQVLYFGDGDFFKDLRTWASPAKDTPKTVPAADTQIRDLLKTNNMHLYAMDAPVPAVAYGGGAMGRNPVAVLIYANLDHAFMPIAALRADVTTLLGSAKNTTFDLVVRFSTGQGPELDDIGNMSKEQLAGAFDDLQRQQDEADRAMAGVSLGTGLANGGDGTMAGFQTALEAFAANREGLIRGAIWFTGGAPVIQTQMGYGTVDSPTLRTPYVVHQAYGPQDQEIARQIIEFAHDESIVITPIQLGRRAAINVEAWCWDALLQNFMLPGSGSLLSQIANGTGGTLHELAFPDAHGPGGGIIVDGTVSQLSDTIRNLAMNLEGQPGGLRLDQGVGDFVGRQHDALAAWLTSSNFVSPSAKMEMDVVAAPERPMSVNLQIVEPSPPGTQQ